MEKKCSCNSQENCEGCEKSVSCHSSGGCGRTYESATEEILQKIRSYQACEGMHPMTCGNDSGHAVLKPFEEGGMIKLRCPDCDYIQDSLPECVLLFEEDTK